MHPEILVPRTVKVEFFDLINFGYDSYEISDSCTQIPRPEDEDQLLHHFNAALIIDLLEDIHHNFEYYYEEYILWNDGTGCIFNMGAIRPIPPSDTFNLYVKYTSACLQIDFYANNNRIHIGGIYVYDPDTGKQKLIDTPLDSTFIREVASDINNVSFWISATHDDVPIF